MTKLYIIVQLAVGIIWIIMNMMFQIYLPTLIITYSSVSDISIIIFGRKSKFYHIWFLINHQKYVVILFDSHSYQFDEYIGGMAARDYLAYYTVYSGDAVIAESNKAVIRTIS